MHFKQYQAIMCILQEPKGTTLQPIDENSEQASVENCAATPQQNLTEEDLPRFPDLNDLKVIF